MLKKVLNVGRVLNNKEQQAINGGMGDTCRKQSDCVQGPIPVFCEEGICVANECI